MTFENEATKQIQAWPTPELFVRRGGGPVQDFGVSSYALDDFVALNGLLVPVTDDTATGFALQSMLTNGAQPSIQSDDTPAPSFVLQSFVAVTADPFSTSDDTPAGAFALDSFVAVLAQQTTQTDDATADFALQSMTVP